MSAQLCQLARDWAGTLPPDGLVCELKHDGFRCLWFRGIDGQPRLWTRNGMPLNGCDHITYRMRQMEEAAGCALFVDGELVVDGTLAATKAWVERGWKGGGEAGIFHAFDVLTDADWRVGGGDAPLYQRKAWLASLITGSADDWTWRPGSRGRDEGAPAAVQMVADLWCADAADVLDEALRVWAADGEGCMIKDPMAPYRRTRNASWAKVKRGGPWLRRLHDDDQIRPASRSTDALSRLEIAHQSERTIINSATEGSHKMVNFRAFIIKVAMMGDDRSDHHVIATKGQMHSLSVTWSASGWGVAFRPRFNLPLRMQSDVRNARCRTRAVAT